MNEDRELLSTFRALAAEGPRQAPAYIEERLKWEFRRRHHRRNVRKWVAAFSAAAAAGVVLLLSVEHARPKPAAVDATSVAGAVLGDETSDTSFYPLPEAEALPAVENAMVVRVQLPVSSLQLMGVPVGEDRADTSVQADLLLGQDGLARGVRLVE